MIMFVYEITFFNDVFVFQLKDQVDYHHHHLSLLALQYKYDLIVYKSHHDQQNWHVQLVLYVHLFDLYSLIYV